MKKLLLLPLILLSCVTHKHYYETATIINEKDSINLINKEIPFYYPVPYFDTTETEKINWKDSTRYYDLPILKPYIDTFNVVIQDTAENIIKTYNWYSKSFWIDNYTMIQDDNLFFYGDFQHYNDSLVGQFTDKTGNFNKSATFIFHRLDSIEIQIVNNIDTNNYFIDSSDPFGNCPDTVTIFKAGWMYLTKYDTIRIYDTIKH